ncbi:MAG: hypothetical protein ACI4O3_04535 [Oscillospiraceae bacterium]
MPDKAEKKKPEIVQPRPDIILPDDNGTAGSSKQDMQRAPAPRGETEQKEL